MRFFAVLAGIGLLAGCFESKLTYCDNGAICPETLSCTERTATPCGDGPDVAACRGIADRTACSSPTHQIGTCDSGVCIACVPEKVECRFDEWKPMASPTTQTLTEIWAVADDDVYAAGAGAVLIHYDGTAWTAMTSPPTSLTIDAIWASAAGDVVAVASNGDAFRFVDGSWQTITPMPQVALFAIWGTKIDELFVSGLGGAVLRYDGTTWTPMTSNTPRNLNAIWGANATSLVAAGAAGVIQQYNGSNWQAAPSTPLTGLTFQGVWTSGTRLVAVGIDTATPASGVIATKEAAAWNSMRVSNMFMASVWGRRDDDIYSVGAAGTIMHFDGAAFVSMASGTQQALQAVGGTDGNVFAVGAGGTILRYSPRD